MNAPIKGAELHIPYSSPEAASLQTVTGWVSRDGRFWGDDEHMARFCGATHRQCKQCEAVEIKIDRLYCDSCLELRRIEKYKAMPREQWDGAALLYLDGTDRYFQDPNEAREYANDKGIDRQGRPICKLHGLRMLDPEVFSRFPFASADSTNIGRNVGIDSAWRGTYTPPTKEARAALMRERIEAHQSLTFWDRQHAPIQESLFGSQQ
ncbi:hypothetical protein [Herbaspirillum aquaticum]|uniref:hypothetical protein n=1 Tax=Herbaspirillum aquaticum TaxID=568783 RepID=UPI0019D49B58|nr:hypothetical protein [Herbaspirillum aquaticum]